MDLTNGQFDEVLGKYVFDHDSKTFKKIEGEIPKDAIVMYYTSSYTSEETAIEEIKDFNLSLFEYGKPVESVNGTISKADPNHDYYEKVDFMRKKASELLKKRKQNA